MAGMLDLVEQDFHVSMINILRHVMEKVDNMQGQMGIVSREKY